MLMQQYFAVSFCTGLDGNSCAQQQLTIHVYHALMGFSKMHCGSVRLQQAFTMPLGLSLSPCQPGRFYLPLSCPTVCHPAWQLLLHCMTAGPLGRLSSVRGYHMQIVEEDYAHGSVQCAAVYTVLSGKAAIC